MDAIFDERDITIEICLKKLEIVLKKHLWYLEMEILFDTDTNCPRKYLF